MMQGLFEAVFGIGLGYLMVRCMIGAVEEGEFGVFAVAMLTFCLGAYWTATGVRKFFSKDK